ncbi:MAG: carbamoyl-phosphate synthase (glutamine-hydrolyzing) large subunit [Candidatus Lokiarchaeota archaeon]|nr:carbamoyl-phosphate synthase (glutamine-hydrolyzing) large subunit [Candidatus Lokiarchaeota archaeon]
MPLDKTIEKCLVLGSGAIKIGQAGEFDYSGSQVLKALQEEGIYTILINPNIATIQTDPELSDRVYLLPVNLRYVKAVIEKERPDSIMLAFGGQTALNVGVQLKQEGVLNKYGVRVLGTPISAIEETEDRELFRQAMIKAGVQIAKSGSATSLDKSIELAEEIGFPLMLRVAFTLGGRGSGVAYNMEQFKTMVNRALAQSMIAQVLVEEYMGGWKEIEYEVVRDNEDNTLTVCNMENIDPVGIHTGESIVIAPSQTLTNEEYHMLRTASINVIKQLGVVGECNIQYALHPRSKEFRAIEVNARLSRSSALASKATGYPLAYVAAKIAIGYNLDEISNKVTDVTTACFEPALDYVVLKIPRWDLQKFRRVSRQIGTQMKSVGEVMAIGRNFEEVLQKAIRMLDVGLKGEVCNSKNLLPEKTREEIEEELKHPTDRRIFYVADAIKMGVSIDEIYKLSWIDKWFLYKIENIVEIEDMLGQINLLTDDQIKNKAIRYAKKFGFSDGQIAIAMNTDTVKIRNLRRRYSIVPVVKQIDTLAAEWPAATNYLYMTYGGTSDDLDFEKSHEYFKDPTKKKIVVLGSGVYRIGASVEFDWGCVNMAWALKKQGVEEVIMINYNPETVSTDYDVSDKLYFEELSGERVMDILEKEKPFGTVVSVGGQIGNNLTQKFTKYREVFRKLNLEILGTEGRDINRAENRAMFSGILDQLSIAQPQWKALSSKEEALDFASEVEYPVLIRPSYVLSGAAMNVAQNEAELSKYLDLATLVSKDNPVVITKFFTNAREIDVDGISDGETVFIGAVAEHVENAGVHSGDATMSIPAITLQFRTTERVKLTAEKIARALNIRGPFNIQFLVKNNQISVIECNLRSSRSMPYVSKTRGINLMRLAAEVILDKKIPKEILDYPYGNYVVTKVPQFSFMRLDKADPRLGVEMASTGEVACIGDTFPRALIRSMRAVDMDVPIENANCLITVAGAKLKRDMIPIAKKFEKLGFNIFSTKGTAVVLKNAGIKDVQIVGKIRNPDIKPNILDMLVNRKFDLVINIPRPTIIESKFEKIMRDEYTIRRKAVEFKIPCITNKQLASALADAIEEYRQTPSRVLSLNEYHDRCLKDIYW